MKPITLYIPLLLVLWANLLISLPAAAADSSDASPNAPAKKEAGVSASTKKLVGKLSTMYGRPVHIGILAPLDLTSQGLGRFAEDVMRDSLLRYGNFDVKKVEDTIATLSLEEFHRLTSKNHIDVTVINVLKPTNIEVYIYDRRNFYNIYTFSELLPESLQYHLTKTIVEEYTRAVFRRALYNYVNDQSFELPRDSGTALMTSEIPRWIATADLVHKVNHDLYSSFYGALSGGAAFTSSTVTHVFDLMELQLGWNIGKTSALEFNYDAFSYNTFGILYKFNSDAREKLFQYSFGIGPAIGINDHAIDDDISIPMHTSTKFIIGSAALTFPIVDLHLKIESKIMYDLAGRSLVFALTPGFMFYF